MGNLPNKLSKAPDGIKVLYSKLDEKSRKQLMDLDKEEKIDEKAMCVMVKILSNESLKKKVGAKLKEASLVFSTPETLRQLYLNTDWAEALKKYEEQFQSDKNEEEEDKKGGFSSMMSTGEVDEIEEKLNEKELTEKFPELKATFQKVRIKLVIAEVSHTKTGRNFRKMISPVLSKLDLLPEFGMFHSALMIGPWMIDWNDSAICIPRKCVSQAALISADIGEIASEKKLEDIINKVSINSSKNKLSEVICQWNSKKLYKDQPPKKQEEGNCQDFVTDILQKLDVKIDFQGPLGSFVKKLREEGKCKISFEMDTNFREKFGVKEKIIEFKTHQELDNFVIKLLKVDNQFEKNCPDHYRLLKSFDRAFWLRFFKFPNDSKYTPCHHEEEEESQCDCPFKNPKETRSMIDEN